MAARWLPSASPTPTGRQATSPTRSRRSPTPSAAGDRFQTLLGATGTGKTATMAWIAEQVQKPTLVIAHNKTLAAQLCNEFREFLPGNAVEYFVSYYDYYQPEAYVPQADLYIEKDASVNDDIDRLRHAATAALLARRDVLIVASVSCIYGIGSPEEYEDKTVALGIGLEIDRGRDAPEARRHPVRAQRLAARARAVPRARRRRRGAARAHGVGLPDLLLRRRGRADHALRPAHRRDLRPARAPGDLPGDAVRHLAGDDRALGRGDQAGARGPGAALRVGGEAPRGPPDPPADRVRPRDAPGARLLQRDRELLADPRRARAGDAAAHPARLLRRGLPRHDRRVAPDRAPDRRHVRGRPLAQGDARRVRLPPPLGARQPPAPLRRVPRAGAAAPVRLRDARAVRAPQLDQHRRADHPSHGRRRPRGRAAARRRTRSTIS